MCNAVARIIARTRRLCARAHLVRTINPIYLSLSSQLLLSSCVDILLDTVNMREGQKLFTILASESR